MYDILCTLYTFCKRWSGDWIYLQLGLQTFTPLRTHISETVNHKWFSGFFFHIAATAAALKGFPSCALLYGQWKKSIGTSKIWVRIKFSPWKYHFETLHTRLCQRHARISPPLVCEICRLCDLFLLNTGPHTSALSPLSTSFFVVCSTMHWPSCVVVVCSVALCHLPLLSISSFSTHTTVDNTHCVVVFRCVFDAAQFS